MFGKYKKIGQKNWILVNKKNTFYKRKGFSFFYYKENTFLFFLFFVDKT